MNSFRCLPTPWWWEIDLLIWKLAQHNKSMSISHHNEIMKTVKSCLCFLLPSTFENFITCSVFNLRKFGNGITHPFEWKPKIEIDTRSNIISLNQKKN
jgi:hypothetical protein